MHSILQGKPIVANPAKRHSFCPPLYVETAVAVIAISVIGMARIANAVEPSPEERNGDEKLKRAWSGGTMAEEMIAQQKQFYSPSMQDDPTLLDWVRKGEILPPLLNDHEYDPVTGKLFRPDGEPLDVPAALWNARMDYSQAHHQPSTPPSVYDRLMMGEFNVPLLAGLLFDGKTGVLYRQDGRKINPDGAEVDRKAWFWNARICYFAPTKPGGPTILDWIISGDVEPPQLAGHELDPNTGKLIRKDGRSLDIGAEMWNARVEYSITHHQPSNPPTPFDLFATYTGSYPPTGPGCHLDPKTGKLYRTDGKPLDNSAELWNARLDYRPGPRDEGQEESLYDKLMTGEEELPSIPGHRFDASTGHLVPEDGGSPSLEAARWNARIDHSTTENSKPVSPTLRELVLSGKENPPAILGHAFDPSTGYLVRKNGGELDMLAEVWNARVDYSAAHRQPSDPPTLYDQVMTGKLTPPSFAHHHFDAQTGLLYTADEDASLDMGAALWNMRMESDRKGKSP